MKRNTYSNLYILPLLLALLGALLLYATTNKQTDKHTQALPKKQIQNHTKIIFFAPKTQQLQ